MRVFLVGLAACLVLVSAGCTIERVDSIDGSFFDRDASWDSPDGAKPDAAKPDASKPDASKPDAAKPDAARDDDSGTLSSDSGADSAIDVEPMLGPSDAPRSLAKGLCAAFEACRGPVLLLDFLNRNPCEDFVTAQQTDRDLHFLNASIAAGRAVFNAKRWSACQGDLEAYGCDVQSHRLPDSCKQAIQGKVAVDNSCNINYDCAGDAYCDKGLSGDSCPGTCRELQTAGLPCLASVECVDGYVCRGGVCATPLAEGASCQDAVCPVGLTCQGPSGSRTCRSIETTYAGKLNASCDPTNGKLCQVGLTCESQSASAGKCVMPVARNAKCRRASPNECPIDQYCKDADAKKTTQPAPGVVGVCADLPSDTESCAVITTCAPGSVCLKDNTCHAYKPAGESCLELAECYSGVCDQGMCVTPLDCSL